MKKAVLLFCVFIFIIAFAGAEVKSNHHFSIAPNAGILSGEIEEIVYVNSVSTNKISQLNWDISPLFYAGIDLNYSWRNNASSFGIFSDLHFKYGIPGKTGQMQDRDWYEQVAILDENDNISGYNNSSTYPYWLTHYSEHENQTKTAILFDVNVGLGFQLKHGIRIRPFVSYSFMYYSFGAFGGSVLYPGSTGHQYYSSSEEVITYEQYWHIFAPGILLHGEMNQNFEFDLSFKFSHFVWCFARDNHILRSLIITDILYGGIFLEPGFVFSYKPVSWLALSFSLSYRYISGTRGDSESNEGSKVTYNPNNAGVSYSTLDFAIIVRFNFGKQ